MVKLSYYRVFPFNANWLNQQYAEIIQAILFDVVVKLNSSLLILKN